MLIGKRRMKQVARIEQCSIVKQSHWTFKSLLQHVLALSHGETSFMKPNLMRLVASCDTAVSHIRN